MEATMQHSNTNMQCSFAENFFDDVSSTIMWDKSDSRGHSEL
jgi:hypothetical protein